MQYTHLYVTTYDTCVLQCIDNNIVNKFINFNLFITLYLHWTRAHNIFKYNNYTLYLNKYTMGCTCVYKCNEKNKCIYFIQSDSPSMLPTILL